MLEGLFDAYYDKVYAFLYARCGNKSTAEDLADISELTAPDDTEAEFMQNEAKNELLSMLSQLDERLRITVR